MTEPLEAVHHAVVKVGVSEDGLLAVVIIDCGICGRVELPEIAVQHLMTVSNATAEAARMLGVGGTQSKLGDVTGPESAADAFLNEKRRKAGLN